jgi:hypothetical protein
MKEPANYVQIVYRQDVVRYGEKGITVRTSSMGSNDAFAFSTAITQAARMKFTPSCTSPMPESGREGRGSEVRREEKVRVGRGEEVKGGERK